MANLAGQKIVAGKVSGERIATTVVTSDNVTTAEEVVASVVAPLVSGRIYKIVFAFAWQPNAANDQAFARIRQDSVTGTEIQLCRFSEAATGTHFAGRIETEFTATLTASKTFVATLARSPAGTATLNATAARPTFLYVDYIR